MNRNKKAQKIESKAAEFNAKSYEKNGLTEDEVMEIKEAFDLFLGDDEKADKIELKHLKRVAKELNENMSEDELNEMITRADTDRDGKVSFDEFYKIMTKKI